jgi:hypothetical protein
MGQCRHADSASGVADVKGDELIGDQASPAQTLVRGGLDDPVAQRKRAELGRPEQLWHAGF